MQVIETILDQETERHRADLEIAFEENTLFIHQSRNDDCDELLAAVCIQDGIIKVIVFPEDQDNVTIGIREADQV